MTMDLFADVFAPRDARNRFYGVTIGIVTNNQDPDKLGRVKVKFPWLSEEEESGWARIVTPMAGNSRGLYLLPEVDDEVLVAFEHGVLEAPYVLGALWNGQDAPPEQNDDGENNKRTLKSRSGHIVRLDDTDGSEKIEIVDRSGKQSIVISTADNSITIRSEQDLTIQSDRGTLKLSADSIELTAQRAIKIESSGNLDAEASGQMTIKGTTVDIN